MVPTSPSCGREGLRRLRGVDGLVTTAVEPPVGSHAHGHGNAARHQTMPPVPPRNALPRMTERMSTRYQPEHPSAVNMPDSSTTRRWRT